MKRQIYFLLIMFFYNFLICGETDQKESIFNGFTHFLSDIYFYENKPLIGGLSKNKQYLYSVNEKKYVVRVLGEELSKRRGEVVIHCLAADKGIAPKVYYCADDYSFIIMDFVDDHTLLWQDAREAEVLDLIAQKVHAVKQLDHNAFIYENGWNLFGQINKDYHAIKDQGHEDLNCMIDQAFQSTKIIHQKIENEKRSLVPCHNDLNYRNIFFTEKNIIFIDWEMAGINYDFYDLAYYSVFSCLNEKDDVYLLTRYLAQAPTFGDIAYFKNIKLMIRCCNIFYLLAFLENIPQSIPEESIQDFEFYAYAFSQDAKIISPEFLYKIAFSQLRKFFAELKDI